MPTYNDYGIVLNSHDLGESDKILNIYTKENALVRAVVKGSRKTSSKFSGRTDQLSCCYFQFAKGKNLDTICDCEQVNSFPSLRSNLTRLTSAILFLEIVSNFAHEDESDSLYVYDLLYKSLDRLQISTNTELDSVVFISNFLSIHGYKPQFDTCVHCSIDVLMCQNTEEQTAYSSILGGTLCNACALIIEHKQIKSSLINIMKAAVESSECLWTATDIRLTLNILREHLDLRAKNKIKSFDLVLSL